MSDEELVLDNIKTWTGLAVKESNGMTEDRDKMDKVRRWCGQPSDREDGRRTEQNTVYRCSRVQAATSRLGHRRLTTDQGCSRRKVGRRLKQDLD